MSKCCLYCRVDGASTESNRLAINQQLTALRSLAGQLGFSISAEMLQYESEGLAAIGEKLTAAGIRVYCPDGEIDLAPAYSHGYFRVATMEQTM